jgi:hypothetical protein
MVAVMVGDADEKKPEVVACWDYEMDGKLVYHCWTYSADDKHDPLWRITVEFLPDGRRQLSDAGCRRLVDGLACRQPSNTR